MNTLVRRLLITLGVSAAALLVLALLPMTLPIADDYKALSAPVGLPVVAIHEGIEASQEIRASGRAIEAASVLLRNGKPAGDGAVRLEVARKVDGGWKTIGRDDAATARLPVEGLCRFKFKKPIRVVAGEPLLFTLTVDGDPKRAVGLVHSPILNHGQLPLSVNGVAQPGSAQLVVYYQRASGTIASLSPLLWKRVTIFCHLFGKVLLAGGFFLALIGFVHLSIWVPDDEEIEGR